MRSFKLLLSAFVFGVAALLLVSAPASAVLITYNGTPAYSDAAFENLGTTVSHLPYEDTTGAYLPVPTAGTVDFWGNSAHKIQVTDYVGGVDPGPNQGNNYLRQLGTSTYVPRFAAAAVGNAVHYETSFYLVSGWLDWVDSDWVVGAATHICINRDGAGSMEYEEKLTGFHYPIPGLSAASLNAWHNLSIDYIAGTGTGYTVTLDGVTSGTIAFKDGPYRPVGWQMQAIGGRVYLDQIPEPGAIAILASGLIALLAYAWRKRK